MATVLVAYASRHGATHEIAEWIAGALEPDGLTVLLRHADEVGDLEGIDAVVIGGPIYVGRVLIPIPSFFCRHRTALGTMPVALFLSGTLIAAGNPRQDERGYAIAESVRQGIPIVALALFGGRFSWARVSIIGRFVPETAPKDTRDRPAIEAWAKTLRARFGL